MSAEGDTVAVFDFDGTLFDGDSLIPFLRRLVGTPRLVVAASRAWRQLIQLPRGGAHRDVAKAALLARVLAGVDAGRAASEAADYAHHLERELRSDVLERLRWHERASHEVVIVSASPELYLRPLATRLGVSQLLCTQLEVDGDRFTGRLLGANVRGEEKVRRLREWLGPRRPFIYAYGDSDGDRPLLAGADVATWVTRRERLPSAPVTSEQ